MCYIFGAIIIGLLITFEVIKRRIVKGVTKLCADVHALVADMEDIVKAREAWKTYAIAIETLKECNRDQTCPWRQRANAKQAVWDAAQQLCILGEYPDIYESSPYLT